MNDKILLTKQRLGRIQTRYESRRPRDNVAEDVLALVAEVRRLQHVEEIRQRGCDCNDEDACRFARERDEARAEVERLQAERDADYHEGYRAGQEDMQDRCAALCDDWEADSYCDGWREMEIGAQHCAEAIRALEVE